MIVQNKKTLHTYYITKNDWDDMVMKGMAKKFTVMPGDLPPIPSAPMPEELVVKMAKCCSEPCTEPCKPFQINDPCNDEQPAARPLTIQDLEGETPKPKRSKRIKSDND